VDTGVATLQNNLKTVLRELSGTLGKLQDIVRAIQAFPFPSPSPYPIDLPPPIYVTYRHFGRYMGDIPFENISVYTPEPGHRGIDIRQLDNTFI
jgi:hypothetical protein